jgi:hypothetical protein
LLETAKYANLDTPIHSAPKLFQLITTPNRRAHCQLTYICGSELLTLNGIITSQISKPNRGLLKVKISNKINLLLYSVKVRRQRFFFFFFCNRFSHISLSLSLSLVLQRAAKVAGLDVTRKTMKCDDKPRSVRGCWGPFVFRIRYDGVMQSELSQPFFITCHSPSPPKSKKQKQQQENC